jgi:CRISPR-associated protein Cas1
MLSFGYQLLWNHILMQIELQGLDPYEGCLHTSHHNHPSLVSDLIEEFRAPIIDSLVLRLINTGVMDASEDFSDSTEGCFLNHTGRSKFLQAFLHRMEDTIQLDSSDKTPRWDIVNHQIKDYKRFVTNQSSDYIPYSIR